MRRLGVLAIVAITAGLVAGCEDPARPSHGSAMPEPTSSTPMSPSDLPTMAKPTALPTVPTDLVPRGVLVGRVSALSEACTEVVTDEGVVWSLSGDPGVEIAVGDTVSAKVVDLAAGEEPCGPGPGAQIVSLTTVG